MTDKLPPEEFAQIVKNAPLVSIDLIAVDGGNNVLLGRRSNEPAKGFWFVPGGSIRKNERITAAFRRLTRDELGVELSIASADFMGIFEHFYPTNFTGKDDFDTHYICLAYIINVSDRFDSLPEDQHSEYSWMNVDQLMNDPEVHENTKAYF